MEGHGGFGGGIWETFAGASEHERAAALLELGEGLEGAGDAREAVQAAMAAIETAQRTGDAGLEARGWMLAGQAHVKLGQQRQGRDCYVHAARIHDRELRWREQGHCLLAAYDCARMADEADEHVDLLEQAYSLVLGVDDLHASAYAALRMAQRELDRNELSPAIEFVAQARQLAGDDLDMVLMIADAEATAFEEAGDHDGAISALWQAVDIAESVRHPRFPAYETWRLVGVLRRMGDVLGALDLANSGLSSVLDEHAGDADAIGSFHLEIARCLHQLGRFDDARVALRKARHHLLVSGNAAELAACEHERREWESS